MPAENYDLMLRLRAGRSYRCAADIVRMSLLEQLGGIYSDIDIGPPMHKDQLVDLTKLIPMRGLVILNENFARNVGNSAVFFGNNFMASSPHQPLIRHVVRQLPRNLWFRIPESSQSRGPLKTDYHHEPHHTGPYLLNRSLAGVVTLLPITFARRYLMVRDGKWDIEKDAPATFDEIEGELRWGCPDSLREP